MCSFICDRMFSEKKAFSFLYMTPSSNKAVLQKINKKNILYSDKLIQNSLEICPWYTRHLEVQR